MNFKRFHESKNLFDKDNFTFGTDTTIVYVPIYVGEGTFTLSTDFPEHNTKDVFLIAGNVSSGASSSSNGVSVTTPRTRTAIDGYVTIATRYNNRENPANYNYMLNTGSTALPYEPYSSEVWHDTPHYIHNTSTDTLTTLPADIYANDTTATVGLKGNMEQSGTPSPSSPVMPQECGERTGNLFDYTKTDGIIANKFINQSGAMVTNNEYYISYPIKVNVGESYTWRFNSNSIDAYHTAPTVGFYDSSDNLLSVAQHAVSVKYFSFEVPANCAYIRASVFTRSNAQKEAMLNTGSAPLPFEPYGVKIPILSGGTTTPVYLGEVETTRQIYKMVLTGEETNWYKASSGSIFYMNPMSVYALRTANIVTCMCSHYTAQVNVSVASGVVNLKCCMRAIERTLYIRDDTYTSVNAFKAFLQQQYANGTPVCVWYVLETPTTGIVNEPIRKIGDYADEVSGITIPTTAGANTLSVDTTLQPSEVTVNYKGWHPVVNVHERENGAWT